ncbi:hypothetical protein TREES_T100012943 [Tupaia chinensis]|uniref:Uncharacterized protein n=1 Tax=Tupaia chinensis TaxID=246437 RepID=L9L3Z8_TUPCH|nr:hypothetical protein TREES_T100012943 [Tupaia chinensis]
MQQSGIPMSTHQKGDAACYAETALHRTFQIKTFSTELKNHVMVMDLVKSNWFPSQRRAKVCVIHMCQGLKTAEQTASRYEVWLTGWGNGERTHSSEADGGVAQDRDSSGVLSGLTH